MTKYFSSKSIIQIILLLAFLSGAVLVVLLFQNIQPSWKIQDNLICDIDHDGEQELLLLVWKKGTYGNHHPFYEDGNTSEIGQHIFIYKRRPANSLKFGLLKAIWMSSTMPDNYTDWSFSQDSRLSLVSETTGQIHRFDWDGWGLMEHREPSSDVSFVCFGDLIAHHQIYEYADEHMNGSYDFLFEHIQGRVQSADLAAIVQETPFAATGDSYSEYPEFSSPPEIAKAQQIAGFDIIACATNHMLDQGLTGLNNTFDTYSLLGDMTVLGIHSQPTATIHSDINRGSDDNNNTAIISKAPTSSPSDPTVADNNNVSIIHRNGISIALLDYTYGTNFHPIPQDAPDCIELLDDTDRVRKQILKAKESSDATIVFVHWGNEYKTDISSFQNKWTDLFYECGVDVVVGSHPHVLQPFEMVTRDDSSHQMLVYYSLGNFVSGQKDLSTILGGMASFTIHKENGQISVTDYDLEPLITHQERKGIYTTYFLRDYTDDLAQKHRLNLSIPDIWLLFDEQIKSE